MQRQLCAGIFIWAAFWIAGCAEDKYYESNAYPVKAPSNTRTNTSFEVPLNLAGLASIGKGNVKVNPEHGKPGHSCNLPVGAPLNTEPAPSSAMAQKILSLPLEPGSVTLPPDAPNPEHGKPGHRCDIAIGAPLNSPAPSSSPIASVQNTQPEALPGMNPAHGKPGHRCDIAVGAPLKTGK